MLPPARMDFQISDDENQNFFISWPNKLDVFQLENMLN